MIALVAALLASSRGPGVIRSRLKHDAEVLEKLPESRARNDLIELLRDEIAVLRRYDQGRRDIPMMVVALLATPLLGYLTIWLAQLGKWWSIGLAIPFGLLALVFAYGIFETAQRVPRDSKGKRLTVDTIDHRTTDVEPSRDTRTEEPA